jgi:hypothetical protein
MNYQKNYFKYKEKYLKLRKQLGGSEKQLEDGHFSQVNTLGSCWNIAINAVMLVGDITRNDITKKSRESTAEQIYDSGKVLFMSGPPLDRFKGGSVFHSRNLHFTLYYNSSDQTLNIFYKSVKESSEKIVVITNKNTVFNIQTKPYHWTIKSLGIFNEIHHVRVDNSEKIIYEQSFDNEFREMFKIKSYIKNE